MNAKQPKKKPKQKPATKDPVATGVFESRHRERNARYEYDPHAHHDPHPQTDRRRPPRDDASATAPWTGTTTT